MFLGVLSVVTVLRAQESAPAPSAWPAAPSGAPAGAAREAATAGETPAPPAAGAPDGTVDAPAPKGPSPSRFEPTEKVRADFDVSFPIDI